MNVETFPDSVVSMTVVRADGEIVEIAELDPDMVFARVALGTLGLIYSVTLRCPRARNIRCETRKIPVDRMLEEIQTIVEHHEAVMVMWYPYTKNAIVMLYDSTDERITFGPWQHRLFALRQYIVEGLIGRPMLGLMVRIAPRLMPWPMRLASALTPESVKVETQIDGVHWQFTYPAVWDSSWAVPIEDASDAWRAWMHELDAFAARRIYPITMVMFARFLKGSQSPLSPDFGRASCYVEATSLKPTPGVLDFYQRIEDVMITRFDARPHWAKYFHDYERVRGQYRVHLIDAERVRTRWDPQGRFMNGFLERMFAPFDEA
jgi:L-gulonolactone oxidase